MYKVKLTKVQGGNAVRTNEVIGTTNKLPVINTPFSLLGKSLTSEADFRIVQTSPIVQIDVVNEKTYTLTTHTGSVYQVEVLNENSD